MKMKLLIAALFLSVGAYAQTQPQVHMNRKDMTPQQRADLRAERKAKWEAMSPAERGAFKVEMKRKHEERLAKMTPEQRQKYLERKRQRKEGRRQHGS